MLDIDPIMGNIWKRLSRGYRSVDVPRTLEELLRDFNDSLVADPDLAIESNVWTQRFRDYLRDRDLNDEVLALKFLVLTQFFFARCEEESGTLNNNRDSSRKKISIETRARQNNMAMRDIFVLAGDKFFSENAEEQLSLSSLELFKTLSRATNRLRSNPDETLTADDITALNNARSDMSIWHNGLRPRFMKFIKTQNTSSNMACLLSIM